MQSGNNTGFYPQKNTKPPSQLGRGFKTPVVPPKLQKDINIPLPLCFSVNARITCSSSPPAPRWHSCFDRQNLSACGFLSVSRFGSGFFFSPPFSVSNYILPPASCQEQRLIFPDRISPLKQGKPRLILWTGF